MAVLIITRVHHVFTWPKSSPWFRRPYSKLLRGGVPPATVFLPPSGGVSSLHPFTLPSPSTSPLTFSHIRGHCPIDRLFVYHSPFGFSFSHIRGRCPIDCVLVCPLLTLWQTHAFQCLLGAFYGAFFLLFVPTLLNPPANTARMLPECCPNAVFQRLNRLSGGYEVAMRSVSRVLSGYPSANFRWVWSTLCQSARGVHCTLSQSRGAVA